MTKPFPFTVCKECAGSGGGADGLSAYEIAVKNGFEGSEEEWLKSLKAEITEEDKAEIIKAVDEAHAHRCIQIYGEKTVFDLSGAYEMNPNYYANSFTGIFVPEEGKQYAVNWNGKIYICTAKRDAEYGVETYVIRNEEVEDGTDGYFKFVWTPYVDLLDIYYYGRADSCEIMPYSEEIKQLDEKFIPDYVGKTYVDEPFYDKYETADFVCHGSAYPPHTLDATYYSIEGTCPSVNGVSLINALRCDATTSFVLRWGGKEYVGTKENVTTTDYNVSVSFPDVLGIRLDVSQYDDNKCLVLFVTGLTEEPIEPLYFEILGVYTGNKTRKIKAERVPDYISKTEVTEMVGDIDTALDSIIALQNKLIGGDAE